MNGDMSYEGHDLVERSEGSNVGAKGQLFTMIQKEERLCIELVGVDGVQKVTRKVQGEGERKVQGEGERKGDEPSEENEDFYCNVFWNQVKVDENKVQEPPSPRSHPPTHTHT
jgi:hypothetical protein